MNLVGLETEEEFVAITQYILNTLGIYTPPTPGIKCIKYRQLTQRFLSLKLIYTKENVVLAAWILKKLYCGSIKFISSHNLKCNNHNFMLIQAHKINIIGQVDLEFIPAGYGPVLARLSRMLLGLPVNQTRQVLSKLASTY
jgi:hypothetical protein